MDTELSYNQWRQETLRNPYRDEHLTLELPFSVSNLFFPMNRYAAISGTEDVLPQQMYLGTNEIRHDLRILSNMVFPLTLVGAEIVDDDDPESTDSLCNRFNTSA